MIRIVIKSADSIKTINKEGIQNSKNNLNGINKKITDIESLFNSLPSINKKNRMKKFVKFLKFFSKEKKLDEFLLEELSEEERNFLGELFGLKISKNKNYKKTLFFLKNGFKSFHKKLLLKNFFSKNLNAIRKCFIKINQNMYLDFVLENEKKEISEKEKKKNYLNFFFDFPNKNLEEIILYSLKEFKKTNSGLIFCFKKYKEEFLKNLILLQNQRWRFFRKNSENFTIEENRKILSHCILVDYVLRYFKEKFY